MKKLFVPHNLALLAKEKGFDDQCIGKFKDNNLTLLSYSWNNSELSIHNDGISAPMYQQLIDWLFRNKVLYLYDPSKDIETTNKELIECLDKLEYTK